MALVYVIIALGVASVWSFFRWRHGKERFFSWVDTLLSVVLGFAVALLMYSIEREGDSAERRSQLRDLLAVELTHFVQSMEEGYRLEVDLPVDSGTRAPRDSVVLDITQIQPLISEEAAASGLFDDASSIRLLTLSTEARQYNLIIQHILGILGTGKTNQQTGKMLRHARDQQARLRQEIDQQSHDLLDSLKLRRPDIYDTSSETRAKDTGLIKEY